MKPVQRKVRIPIAPTLKIGDMAENPTWQQVSGQVYDQVWWWVSNHVDAQIQEMSREP